MSVSIGDAVMKLGLDKTQFQNGMNQVTNETEKSAKRMQTGLRIVGVAIAAVGAAGLKLVDDARKMNAELGQVSITTGIATDDLRDLAIEISNVTFRMGSVINTFGLLGRAGVKSEEDMKAVANAFDALGDATGSEAETVAAQLIPAFRVFGLELPKTAGELDHLTWLYHNTLIELSDFASVMDYVAMYGSELNVTLDEMVAIMAILNDRGMSGASATRLFRTAVSQATNEGISLNDALKINNDTMDEWMTKISVDAVGATETFADAANEQYGLLADLATKWEDLKLEIGSLLEPLELVFGFMTALGPVLLAMSLTTLPQLVTNLKTSALWFGKLAIAAGKAIAALIVKAAASIWAWASSIPIAGIALGIGGVAALTASIIAIRNRAAEAAKELAEGGIVTSPTRALIGEAGPEAVIPLSKAGLIPGSGELHLHFQIGNYMGDEMSMRQLIRKISQTLQEEGRRNAFGQVNTGYYFGRSSR